MLIGRIRSRPEPMKVPRTATWGKCGGICLLFLATSVVIVAGVNRGSNPSQVLQVLNKTSSLELVSAVPGQQGATVTVKNVSKTRAITGIAFATGREGQVLADLLSGSGDLTIRPGNTYSQTFAGTQPPDISILAAVLDDRTVDGDSRIGQRLLNLRKGKKDQLQLILPILRNALDSRTDVTVAQVIAEINKIPDPEHFDYYIQSGAFAMRESILLHLQDNSQRRGTPSGDPRHVLTFAYEEYSRFLAKL